MDPIIQKSEVFLLLGVTAASGVIFANYLPYALYLDFPLIFTIYVGLYSSPFKGAACGTAFGLVQDYFSALYLGLNGLSKTFFGFSGSYLRKWVTLEGFFAQWILIILLSLLDSTIVYAMLGILGQPLREAFWWDILIKSIMTATAGIIVLRIYNRVKFPRKDFSRIELA